MIHEHLMVDLTCYCHSPQAAHEKSLVKAPVSLKTLTWIRRNYTSNLDNLTLDEPDLAVEELLEFKYAGGGTIVDAGNIGLGRDPKALQRIADASGLNIVMGAGYYVHQSHPANMDEISEEAICGEIVADVRDGVGSDRIRAGLIGELGCSWPMHPNEQKVLRAGAKAQKATGAPISVHVGLHRESPHQIAQILDRAGADLSRVALCHMDREAPANIERLVELCKMGCYLEFDAFGMDTWDFPDAPNYPQAPIDRITDAQRVELIVRLADKGHLDRIVVSHDIAYKMRLKKFGGSGYDHILSVCVPIMRRKGLGDAEMRKILIENPVRLLTFA
ncbi:hypothetical protein X743_33360 [Mesorhizobium sp. LNHC252B00]|nr:hypothetical protein X743_33360 [Mesorhizobium sp. LNHC252B00]